MNAFFAKSYHGCLLWYAFFMIIVSNWKAYVDTREKAEALIKKAKRARGKRTFLNTSIIPIIAPPFPLIGLLGKKISPLQIAAQDVSDVGTGSGTGEVTARLLRDIGVTHVIIGHSERRLRGETDEMVHEKILRAFSEGLSPILCIGERVRDKDAVYLSFLREQIHTACRDIPLKEAKKLIIAYEPVWAIGKSAGEAMRPDELEETVLYIRKILSECLPERLSLSIPVLYGGSVEADNAFLLIKQGRIQGLLVGRGSVDTEAYDALVKSLTEIKK